MKLCSVVSRLEKLAPLKLAESWDNVGLLIEPTTARDVRKVITTIDLTEAVVEEAVAKKCELILSYHPPIFTPLTRITQARVKERIVARCLEERLAVYSPHTAWDSYFGGVNDWLADIFKGDKSVEPIAKSDIIEQCGSGRVVRLKEHLELDNVIKDVKSYLKHPLRIAYAEKTGWNLRHEIVPLNHIRSVGLCAGSGGSLLKGLDVDLFITGELSHHEVLAATAAGTHVILSEHTHTERGYLEHIKPLLYKLFEEEVDIIISDKDVSPLIYY